MKVYFVGIHNKPDMEPLDSKTLSGKTIDRIIAGLNGIECEKVNLFNTDKMPKGDEVDILKADFFNRVWIKHSDIAVLLGREVQRELIGCLDGYEVRIAHPSLQYSAVSRPNYIANAIALIRDVIENNLLVQAK